jgi:hypothetical protein
MAVMSSTDSTCLTTPWGIPKLPKYPNHRSDHFSSSASSLQRFYNFVEQSEARH